MLFVWRGGGLIVPIFLFISGWLTSYSFDDNRLGNNVYMGWTMMWASIPLLLLGLAFLGMNMTDAETGEKPPKSHHDFFFIPVWIWALVFLIGGIIWINTAPDPGYNYSNDIVKAVESDDDEIVEALNEQIVNFYNPYSDTINVRVDDLDGDNRMDSDIPPGSIRYKHLEKGTYMVYHYGMTDKIKVLGSEAVDSTTYDEAWFVAGGGYDLVFLDATIACTDTIDKTELRDIDWMKRIDKRHKGNQIMFPELYKKGSTKYLVKEPEFSLPMKVDKNQVIYSLIPILRSRETTEEYLDSMIIEICF